MTESRSGYHLALQRKELQESKTKQSSTYSGKARIYGVNYLRAKQGTDTQRSGWWLRGQGVVHGGGFHRDASQASITWHRQMGRLASLLLPLPPPRSILSPQPACASHNINQSPSLPRLELSVLSTI